MGGFSPQPEGTGPVFPISSLLVAPVTGYSALLAPRTEKNWLPSPPSEVVLTGPNDSASRQFPWEPASGIGREARASYSGAHLLIDMRKGEPKTSLGLAAGHSRGEHPQPGAATRYLSASRLIAGRLPAPAQSIFDRTPRFHSRESNSPIHSRRPGCSNPCRGPSSQSNANSQGGRILGHAVGAWGNLCKANLPSEGKPPLTAKSLSATTV